MITDTVAVHSNHLEIAGKGHQMKTEVTFDWLRENCRCTSCYNGVTNQRNVLINNIKPDIHPISHSVSDSLLNIHWNDGHCSQYETEWLQAQCKVEALPKEVLWTGDTSHNVAYVTASDIKSKDGITRLVKSLLEYGVGFVTHVEPNLKSTEEVIECVGQPLQTIFGGMWEFSDKMDHLDSAYSNLALDAHTDTSYFIEPAGLIVFHCTKRNCTGGLTLLVDGFRAAKEVQVEAPELYQCLKTVYTEFQYIEMGHHLTSSSTIIQHTADGRIKQVRYNMYDRSARLPFPAVQSGLLYNALRRLACALRRPSVQWWLPLQPGNVVFINNWRVLHGRSAYQGQRTITGAYISMDNLLSRARLLKIIH